MDFLKWYKKTVESGRNEPPTKVWEDIQNDLDIDLVYERLEKTLAKDRRKAWIWRASSAAGILLFLSIGYWLVYREDFSPHERPVAQKSTNKEYTIEPISRQSDKLILPTDSTGTIITIKNNEKTLLSAETAGNNMIAGSTQESLKVRTASLPNVIISKADSTKDRNIDISSISPEKQLAALDLSLPEIPPNLDILESPLVHIENPETKTEFPLPINNNTNKTLSKITVSAHGEVANTWLISPKTKEAFNPQELTANRATFKQNYGFSIAGNITYRWEITGQFSLTKQNGQHYKEYYQGKYVTNQINLEYTDLAFKIRYRPFRKNLNHALSSGIYLGFLDNAYQNIGGEIKNITSDYSNTDFGLIVGYQYFAPITDKITLAAGTFYRQGLKNIFAGNQLVNNSLNHSTNTSFNFTLSLGYTFSL